MLFRLISFVSLFALIVCQKCDTSKDLSALDECLAPLNKSWEDTKRIKPQLDLLTFPLLHVEPQELTSLCTRYSESRAKCAALQDRCLDNHAMDKFAFKQFGYACRSNGSDYARNADCVWSAVNSNQQCVLLLRKNDDETVSECHKLTQFYKCIEQPLQIKCKTKGVAALLHLIDHYGCDLVQLDQAEPKSDRSCEADDDKAVTTCFQPLTSLWNQLKQQENGIENVSMPLFFFKSIDIVRMCDLVEVIKDECPPIRQCPSHPLPQFTNALLGLACGSQQDVFFASFECIRSTVLENTQCTQLLPGVWIPGKHRDACWRLPQFIDCIKDRMLFRCAPQGLAVMAQAMKQYGCSVDTGDIKGNWVVSAPGSRPEPKPANASVTPAPPTAPPGVPTVIPLGPPAPPAAPAPNLLPQLAPRGDDNDLDAGDFPNPRPFSPAAPEPVKIFESAVSIPAAPLASGDVCTSQKRNQVRRCLQPLFARWVQVQNERRLNNLTFPMYHYRRVELLEMCDQYASAFLICPFSVFQECLRDEVVFLANSVLGYLCSPQNVVSFMKHYDCISQTINDRPNCQRFISGPLLLGVDISTRCRGVQEFMVCNQLAVEGTCGAEALNQFRESIRQFGCSVE